MLGDSFVQVILGALVIGFLISYGLSVTYHVGKRAEKGMSLGLEIPQAIICIMIALGIAFSLGQELPYVQMFDWFHSIMALRQPCC